MNNRQTEKALLNFKVEYNRKAELLNEALSDLALNLFGLSSTESLLQQIHTKIQRDCLYAKTAKVIHSQDKMREFEIVKVLELIETRAQLKEWNTPLALLGR